MRLISSLQTAFAKWRRFIVGGIFVVFYAPTAAFAEETDQSFVKLILEKHTKDSQDYLYDWDKSLQRSTLEETSLTEVRRLSKMGNSNATLQLADLYFGGIHVPPDKKEAIKLVYQAMLDFNPYAFLYWAYIVKSTVEEPGYISDRDQIIQDLLCFTDVSNVLVPESQNKAKWINAIYEKYEEQRELEKKQYWQSSFKAGIFCKELRQALNKKGNKFNLFFELRKAIYSGIKPLHDPVLKKAFPLTYPTVKVQKNWRIQEIKVPYGQFRSVIDEILDYAVLAQNQFKTAEDRKVRFKCDDYEELIQKNNSNEEEFLLRHYGLGTEVLILCKEFSWGVYAVLGSKVEIFGIVDIYKSNCIYSIESLTQNSDPYSRDYWDADGLSGDLNSDGDEIGSLEKKCARELALRRSKEKVQRSKEKVQTQVSGAKSLNDVPVGGVLGRDHALFSKACLQASSADVVNYIISLGAIPSEIYKNMGASITVHRTKAYPGCFVEISIDGIAFGTSYRKTHKAFPQSVVRKKDTEFLLRL